MLQPTVVWTKQSPMFNTPDGVYQPTNFEPAWALRVGTGNQLFVAYVASSPAVDGAVSGGSWEGGQDIILLSFDENGNHLWTKQTPLFNTSLDELNICMELGSDNSIYVSSIYQASISGGSYTSFADIGVSKFDSNGNHIWTRQTHTINTNAGASLKEMIVDKLDNSVYVAYETEGLVSGGSYAGGSDIVVFKLDSNGNHQWSNQTPVFNSAYSENSPKIRLGTTGIYIAYQTDGSISGGSLGAPNNAIAVLKLSKTGDFLWSKQSPIFSTDTDRHQIEIGPDDSVYLVYTALLASVVSGGSDFNNMQTDFVLTRISSNGDFLWTRQSPAFNAYSTQDLPGAYINQFDIKVDELGNLIFTYGTPSIISGGSNRGGLDIAVVKFDLDGNMSWSRQFSSSTNILDIEPRLNIASDNSIIMSYIVTTGSNFSFILIRKLSTDGISIWATIDLKLNGSYNNINQDPLIKLGNDDSIFGMFSSRGTGIVDNPLPVSGGSLGTLNNNLTLFRINETLAQPVICVHQDMIVDDLGIPIKSVTEYGEDFEELLFTGETDTFVKIGKGTLEKGIPTMDLYLTPGHKITYKGKRVKVGKLTFKPGISMYTAEKPCRTYNLCFQEEKAVRMHGVEVCQWGKDRFRKLLKKKKWEYSPETGIMRSKSHPKNTKNIKNK